MENRRARTRRHRLSRTGRKWRRFGCPSIPISGLDSESVFRPFANARAIRARRLPVRSGSVLEDRNPVSRSAHVSNDEIPQQEYLAPLRRPVRARTYCLTLGNLPIRAGYPAALVGNRRTLLE